MNDTKFKEHISWKDWRMRTAEQYITAIKHHMPMNIIPDTKYQMGGQGFYSTLNDYKKFQLMLINEGEYDGVRVFKKETIQKYVFKNILLVDDVSLLPNSKGAISDGMVASKNQWCALGQLDKNGTFGWSGFGGCQW
jgi:CubicO group peptidase (beta-lactamase class C family)